MSKFYGDLIDIAHLSDQLEELDGISASLDDALGEMEELDEDKFDREKYKAVEDARFEISYAIEHIQHALDSLMKTTDEEE